MKKIYSTILIGVIYFKSQMRMTVTIMFIKVTKKYHRDIGVSVNSPAKDIRAIRRIAKAAILHGLCPKGMGASVNSLVKDSFMNILIYRCAKGHR